MDIEFLNGIRVRERQVHVQLGVVVTCAVQLIIYMSGSAPVHGGLLLARVYPTLTTQTTIST